MNIKKLTAAALLLAMTASFTACRKEEPVESTTEAPTTTTTETTVSPTPTISPTPTPFPTNLLYDPNNPLEVNPLTGVQDMDPANKGKRSVAVVINNVRPALPQRGVSKADVIYEYETEGRITRLLGVYADVNKIPEVGSLRSARLISADLAAGNNSVFIHYGRDPRAVEYFSTNRITHIDGNYLSAGKYSSKDYKDGYVKLPKGTYFWRDKTWLKKRALEHTAVSDGRHIAEAIKAKGITMDNGTDATPLIYNFVPDKSKDIADSQNTCASIKVFFSGSNSSCYFKFNPEDGMYYKRQYKKDHIDETTGKQLSFKNVFVLFGKVTLAKDNYRTDYHMKEGGKGYYVSNGKVVNITWRKKSIKEPILIFNEEGQPVEVNRGNSYVCLPRNSTFSKCVIKELTGAAKDAAFTNTAIVPSDSSSESSAVSETAASSETVAAGQ